MTEKLKKSEAVRVRLTTEEKQRFSAIAAEIGETESRLLRKCVREMINQSPDLLSDEQAVMRIAIRQLTGMARNLNQITTAINAGIAHSRNVDAPYLNQVKSYVEAVKKEFILHVNRTKTRWISPTKKDKR